MANAATDIQLVEKAILCGVSGCLEWIDDNAQRLIRSDPELQGLTPKGIKQLLVDRVRTQAQCITRRKEKRLEYQDRREFWFRVLVPVSGFPKDLFIELELTDDDVDYPIVTILRAHF